MIITKATKEDLSEILQLQYLSYQSEAKLLNNFDIPPLKQTLQEVQNEYDNGTILKVLDDNRKWYSIHWKIIRTSILARKRDRHKIIKRN